jgi:hypothetical protein
MVLARAGGALYKSSRKRPSVPILTVIGAEAHAPPVLTLRPLGASGPIGKPCMAQYKKRLTRPKVADEDMTEFVSLASRCVFKLLGKGLIR